MREGVFAWCGERKRTRPCRNVAFRLPSVPVNELVEPAQLSIGGLVLTEERQLGFLELVEERVPVDGVKLFVLHAEVEPEHAGGFLAVLGSGDAGRMTAALLRPFPDGVMIGRRGCCRGG